MNTQFGDFERLVSEEMHKYLIHTTKESTPDIERLLRECEALKSEVQKKLEELCGVKKSMEVQEVIKLSMSSFMEIHEQIE